MSKQHRLFYITLASAISILQIFTQAYAQDVIATVRIDKRLPQVAEINGRFGPGGLTSRGRNVSFLLDHAGIQGLGSRISDLRLFDGAGSPVSNRRMIDGEYLAEKSYAAFSYKVSLEPHKRPSAVAHVSWASGDIGVLMLGDVFPMFAADSKVSAQIEFVLPEGWSVHSSEHFERRGVFAVADIQKAVFPVGTGWRNKRLEGLPISVAIAGERQFADAEGVQMVREIYDAYRGIFGGHPAVNMQLVIGPLQGSRPGDWYAETRGTTVMIMSKDMPFKTQSLQRLHEQLRHEIFHLWLPNAVNLDGNYDWFYEGFALYGSLKTGVRSNRIRFDDFLDALSRAHRFDDAVLPKESLIDASENRWGGGNDRVYARGMLAAFLCDVAMLHKSKGKRSIEDLVTKLYETHRNAPAEDGNAAVLRLFRSNSELLPVIDRYITGKERMAWASEVRAAGLEWGPSGLRAVPKPTGSQKALLDKLGYNNWRKLSRNSK